METKKIRNKICLSVLCLVFLETFFFRNVLFTENLIGSLWDGQLTNFISEHWYKVFQGKEKMLDLCMFYPHKNTLAYSDMLLGYGLLHSLLRVCGMDLFLAYKWTLMITHLIGTLATFWLLYRHVKLTHFWCLFGTVLFSFSSMYSTVLEHTQLVAISYVPVMLCFLISAWEKWENRKKRLLYVMLAETVLLLLLYTSWYIGYFTILFACLAVLFYLLFALVDKKNIWVEVKKLTRQIGRQGILYIVYFIGMMIPFVIIYLPILEMAGNRTWKDLMDHMPQWIDLINVSHNNILFGWISEELKLHDRIGSSTEVNVGQPLIFYLFLLLLFILLWRKRDNTEKERWMKRVWIFLLICVILCIRTKSGISIWYIIYKLVPGAGSLRAVARWWFFLAFPISIMTAYTADYFMKNQNILKDKKMVSEILALLLLVCVASNVTSDGVFSLWNRAFEWRMIDEIATPPADCEVFYIKQSVAGEYDADNEADLLHAMASYELAAQMQAVEIATIYDIKTIGGYSGQIPKEYANITNIENPNYEKGVIAYCKQQKVYDIYSYDIVTNQWEKVKILP